MQTAAVSWHSRRITAASQGHGCCLYGFRSLLRTRSVVATQQQHLATTTSPQSDRHEPECNMESFLRQRRGVSCAARVMPKPRISILSPALSAPMVNLFFVHAVINLRLAESVLSPSNPTATWNYSKLENVSGAASRCDTSNEDGIDQALTVC